MSSDSFTPSIPAHKKDLPDIGISWKQTIRHEPKNSRFSALGVTGGDHSSLKVNIPGEQTEISKFKSPFELWQDRNYSSFGTNSRLSPLDKQMHRTVQETSAKKTPVKCSEELTKNMGLLAANSPDF